MDRHPPCHPAVRRDGGVPPRALVDPRDVSRWPAGGTMRKLIANEWMTLDGVVQAPIYDDEDLTGGFAHGGWHGQYLDELSMGRVIANVSGAGGFVLGRGTYELFAAHWPSAPADQQMVAGPLNALPKHVVSTTLTEPLTWENSKLLRGDLVAGVRALKAEDGDDLHVIGSPGLVQ